MTIKAKHEHDCERDRCAAAGTRHCRRAAPAGRPCAFTLVELILVIAVIVLILALAVPGLSTMNADARLASARQTIEGVTRQAYLMSQADRVLTAVRFLPGEWDATGAKEEPIPNRQHLAIYTYVGTMTKETSVGSGSFQIAPDEYFERAKDLKPVRLPEDVWAAPLEALSIDDIPNWNNYGADNVLTGQIGAFAWDATQEVFLDADDFLIVCDPDAGILGGVPRGYLLKAYCPSPSYRYETTESSNGHKYMRYSSSGVVTYRREAFEALGESPTVGLDRQELLRSSGRAYVAHRFSGGLLSGAQRPE